MMLGKRLGESWTDDDVWDTDTNIFDIEELKE